MILGVYLYAVILAWKMSKLFYNDDSKDSKNLFESWSLTKINYILFFVGVLLVILGYFIMAIGEVDSFQSLTLAPTILFTGYIILIPAALIYKKRIIKKD